MKRIFTIYTLARSGHHAVVYWIYAHFKNSIYMNDPFMLKEPLTNKFVYGPDNPPPETFDLSRYLKTKSNVFTGFPDQSISKTMITDSNDPPYEETRIILLRDPFNLFASRMKHLNMWSYRKSPHDILPTWKEHAKEFLETTDIVKAKKLFVNYNEWFRSYEYRQSISDKLEGDKIPGSCILEYISSWGFGSSFDFRYYQGNASKMKVLERWKTVQKNQLYLSLFDEETIELSRNMFGRKFVNNILHHLKI